MFMGDANRTALAELCEHFQQHYAALSHMCMQDGIVQYPFPIKMHYFWHLCCENGGLNPRACWTYRFEDYMGRLVQCATHCMVGTPTARIGAKVCEHYRLVLTLRLRKFLR